jgi:hypothetical protein
MFSMLLGYLIYRFAMPRYLAQSGHVGHAQRKLAGETAKPIPKLPAPGRAAGVFGGGYAPPAPRAWRIALADALQHCLRLSEEIGMIGVVVDAKDEKARGWYERYEFERLPDSPLILWLPMAAIGRL